MFLTGIFLTTVAQLLITINPILADRPFFSDIRKDKGHIRQDRQDLKDDLKDLKKDLKGKGIKIVNGQVTAINGSTLTVTKDGKTFTVNTDSNTKFRRHFWGVSSFAEISVGDRVNVWGRFTDDAKTTILAMMIRDVSIMKRKGTFIGRVRSKSDTSFVIETKRGKQTVMFDSNTKFVMRNDSSMTFAQLNAGDGDKGDKVRVKGLWDKTLNKITEVTQVKDFSQPPKPTKNP